MASGALVSFSATCQDCLTVHIPSTIIVPQSGPFIYVAGLDEVSTGATHELLVNAVKAKDAKDKAGAQKNRPKL
jgi:hypothetical protein